MMKLVRTVKGGGLKLGKVKCDGCESEDMR